MEKSADIDDLRERPALSPGTVLRGKYRIDRMLGVGGMATVYAATHRNRKRFAVKVLHAEYASARSVRSRFVREGYVANTVEHAGVVAVLDDDVAEDGSPFLVMELLHGATVQDLLEQQKLEPAAALLIVEQLLDVLDAAHEKGVVHRDIKPANLFVTDEGQVKVLDFGIARLRDATAGIQSTHTGASLGTPAFMAPEQALGVPDQIDARTDVWAVGATLFRLLTGKLVHEGDNARQLVVLAATEPARSLESVAPELPEAFRSVVDKALAFEKSDRWGSAASMRDAARCVLEQEFGGFERAALGELATAAHVATTESAPTEPAPDSPAEPRREKSTVPERRARTAPDPESEVPSSARTAPPTSEHSGSARAGGRRPRPVVLVAALAAMAGVLFAIAMRGKPMATPDPAANKPSSPAANSAKVTALAPATTSSTPTPRAEAREEARVSEATAPEEAAPAPSSGVAQPLSAHPVAPLVAPALAAPEPRPTRAAGAPPVEAKQRDPLQIELQ